MTRRRLALAAAISVFATGVGSFPAQASAADTITKQYDVSDLITAHPSHALGPEAQSTAGGGGGGGPQGNVFMPGGEPTSETALLRAKILDVVRSSLSVADDSKAVALIGSALVVTEPADAQQTVAKLLEELRAKSNASVQISIDAEWVLVPAGPLPEAATLIADQKAEYARTRVVGFNGQTIGIRQVREVAVVAGVTPVVGTDVKAYQVTSEIDRPGVQLEETSHLQGDGSIVVDVTSEATADLPATKLPATRPDDLILLRPDKLIQSIATTIALKPGQPTLVGGITQDASVTHGKTLCLVLTATVAPPAAAKLFK